MGHSPMSLSGGQHTVHKVPDGGPFASAYQQEGGGGRLQASLALILLHAATAVTAHPHWQVASPAYRTLAHRASSP